MTENQHIILFLFLLAVAAVVVVVYGFGVSVEKDDDKIGVVVTLPPQAEFVDRVGGNHVSVTVMVPGADPHTYEPTPSQMSAVSKAQLYFKIGSDIEFELTNLPALAAQNPALIVVDCSDGITLLPASEEDEGLYDPHIWLSPGNAKIMVETIRDALITFDSGNESDYRENAAAYLTELDELDASIASDFANVSKRAFLTYHPAWAYFADAYNLTQIAIEDRGNEPSPQALASIIQEVREYNITTVFVSPQFSQESADIIADEIGGSVVAIDPLARDYINNMYDVAEKVSLSLK